jgi:aspartyl-tRNA(Asn)/glutamyl-tRNA(Gln) amidotransferase subunit C
MADSRITAEQVERVASLARLELTQEQVQAYRAELDSILHYMQELDSVDVQGVEPSYHAVPVQAALRPDEVWPSLDRDEVLKQAPQAEQGAFAVPRVVGRDE